MSQFEEELRLFTDGSLSQALAYGMQTAVDKVRENAGQSVEQIMLDVVSNQPDGLGPCTTVECLLRASVEAARIYIWEMKMKHETGGYDNRPGKDYGPATGDYGDYGNYGDYGDYGNYGHEDDYDYPPQMMGCMGDAYKKMETMKFTSEEA